MRFYRGVSHALVIAPIVALALALPSPARSAPGGAPQKIPIDNFGCINPNYYRGAQPRGRNYQDLAALGIRTVIDLTKDGDATEPALVQRLGMQFYRIPMTTRETPSSETIARFLGLVSDRANQPVYVHCQGGRHRTGLMTAIYRMTTDGWSASQAFAEMKQYNFGADYLHPEFKKFVFDYFATLVAGSRPVQGTVPK